MSIHKIECEVGGVSYSFETGKLANQATRAVTARVGDTVVLATVVMKDKAREGMNYFPLLVDYEERLYAAGKIKGSRWVKREGRATDDAILTGRVIDRTLRPLFPNYMRNDVQVVVTVLCIDGQNDPDMLAVNAAAMALHSSIIPFDGPVAAVRVGKVGDTFIANPTTEQREKSKMDLIVSGTKEHIMMVEMGADLVPETDIVEGIKFAQKALGVFADAQIAFAKELGETKAIPILVKPNEQVANKVKELLTEERIEKAVFQPDMFKRDEDMGLLYEAISKETAEALGEIEGVKVEADAKEYADYMIKKYMQKQILEKGRRVDGRGLEETRKITAEVGILPRTHGSALFTRGETQVLTVVTLGGPGDAQTLDSMEDPTEGTSKRYIHHYNFPGYSVGEVSPIRGPGRREVGHGALAERAVEIVIPKKDDFPYTMRLVSEVLSSNGSTSMASTCGSSLALMDAGVPIREVIGGVAMGLVLDEETGKYKVLTDIAGLEDFNGHMDFKVTGNDSGVSALQLDIKVKGLTVGILEEALTQAKPGRLHILSKMKEALPAPRTEMSPYAPRIISFYIKPDKIREVIGTGGKVINEIIAKTGVKIDIEDSGLVCITGIDQENSKKAEDWIKNIIKDIEVGEKYTGKVVRIMDFGAFVELLPGKDGMVHISELANYRVGKVTDVVQIGDTLEVQVLAIDEQGRVNLTHRPFAPKGVEKSVPSTLERPHRSSGDRHSGGDRHGTRPHGTSHGASRGHGGGHSSHSRGSTTNSHAGHSDFHKQ